MVGYDLSEDEQHSLVKQLNLLLSFEQERYEDVHLIDPNLTALEISAAEKLLQYVHTTQKNVNSVTCKSWSTMKSKTIYKMSYTTKSSLDLLEKCPHKQEAR